MRATAAAAAAAANHGLYGALMHKLDYFDLLYICWTTRHTTNCTAS